MGLTIIRATKLALWTSIFFFIQNMHVTLHFTWRKIILRWNIPWIQATVSYQEVPSTQRGFETFYFNLGDISKNEFTDLFYNFHNVPIRSTQMYPLTWCKLGWTQWHLTRYKRRPRAHLDGQMGPSGLGDCCGLQPLGLCHAKLAGRGPKVLWKQGRQSRPLGALFQACSLNAYCIFIVHGGPKTRMLRGQ